MTKFKVEGLRELGVKLKKLDDNMQRKIARAVTNAGAQVIKKRIATLAPVAPEAYEVEGVVVQPGNIGRNVIVKHIKPSETPATSEHIVVIRGKKKDGYANRIATLQEFGTVKQAAKPFFRPGAEQATQPALDAMKKRFKQRIDKAIAEASR